MELIIRPPADEGVSVHKYLCSKVTVT